MSDPKGLLPGYYAEDEELGFVDAAIGAAKGIGKAFKAIGGAVKKKKRKAVAKKKAAAAKKILMPATDIIGQIPKGTSATVAAKAAQKIRKAALGADDIRSIVRELVAGVPAQTRAIVLDALKEASAAKLKTADQIDSVAGQVDASLRPEVTAMLAALQTQQLQGQATYEHQSLVAEQDFRKGTQSGLSALSARLDQIEAGQNQIVSSLKLPGVAIVRKRMPIFGPKNVLEG